MEKVFRDMNREERLAHTFFAVEANGFERHCLWQRHYHEAAANAKVSWIEDPQGFSAVVGFLEEKPVTVALNWVHINGRAILFWSAISAVCDFDKIKDWIKARFTPPEIVKTYGGGFTDANSFVSCLLAIEAANKADAENNKSDFVLGLN